MNMRLALVGILCILCLAVVFSAPPRGHRRQSHEIYRLKSFAARLQYYLNRAKEEIKHLREENEELKKKPPTTIGPVTTTTETVTEAPVVECEDDEYKADATNCRKFYHCAHKSWQEKECHVSSCFDPELNICVWMK